MNIGDETCSRCRQALHQNEVEVRTFGCGHNFHTTCLEIADTRCPTCRTAEIGARVALYAGGAVAGAVLAPVLAPAVLGIVGFGAVGPVAGGLAALIQSSIGNVAAGSLFAMAQSVAMGGALPALGYVAGAAGGAAALAAVAGNGQGPRDDEEGGEPADA